MQKEKTREALALVRDRLQSTREWEWSETDGVNYLRCKQMAVDECKAGVKRLLKEDSIRPNGLVLVSD